ncbi:MAG: AAA family ATPase, partial [Promethearchaeota archaeon]
EEIEFPLPNKSERIELIKLFEKKIPFKTEINYELIASKCNGWSGRDIKEKLLKRAVHECISRNLDLINTDLLLEIIKSSNKEEKINNRNLKNMYF